MLPWREFDVSEWEVVGLEMRGRRAKHWVQDPDGIRWLRKTPRPSRPYEPAIEALMLRLAGEVGIISAEGHVCVWHENGFQMKGILVRFFLDADEELALAANLMKSHDTGYDLNAKWAQTMARVREVLARQEAHGSESLLQDFAKVLAFDAWIGNADRHQENWGFITSKRGESPRLAPMYDPAACLGVELGDTHRVVSTHCTAPELLDKYTQRCPSGFGTGTQASSLQAVMGDLVTWPEWQTHGPDWLAAFSAGMDTFERFLATVPLAWFPEPRKQLALALLRTRLKWLQSLL